MIPTRIRPATPVPGRKQSDGDGRDNESTIWALKDISFEIKQGDVLGIIGPNGAGKSTLLKILTGITEPTVGCAEIFGRVGSLLEVGTGFHPELTGRENIYLNGAILGMKKAEIDRNFDEIVSFAEVEQFLDTPVKRYSSGMYVRLAFAVAAHLDLEILLVDEVLAVGDASFQKRCLGKMGEVTRQQGRTVVFVSHNMAAIKSLTKRAIWLQRGQVRKAGSSDFVVDSYLMQVTNAASTGIFDCTFVDANRMYDQKYSGLMKLKSVTLKDADGRISGVHMEGSDVLVEIDFRTHIRTDAIELLLRVRSMEGHLVFTCLPGKKQVQVSPGEYRATVGFSLGPLLPGMYEGSVVLLTNAPQDNVSPAFVFEVVSIARGEANPRLVRYSAASGPESAQKGLGLIQVASFWYDLRPRGRD